MSKEDKVKRHGLAPPAGHISYLGICGANTLESECSTITARCSWEMWRNYLFIYVAVCPQSYQLPSERGRPLDTPDAEFCSCQTLGRYPEERLNKTYWLHEKLHSHWHDVCLTEEFDFAALLWSISDIKRLIILQSLRTETSSFQCVYTWADFCLQLPLQTLCRQSYVVDVTVVVCWWPYRPPPDLVPQTLELSPV